MVGRATCRAQYSRLESTSPTYRTVCCTITITVLSILLELFAHSDQLFTNRRHGRSKHPTTSKSIASPTNHFIYKSEDPQEEYSRQRHRTMFGQQPYEGTQHRFFLSTSTSIRLVVSTLLFMPTMAAFYICVLDATTPLIIP